MELDGKKIKKKSVKKGGKHEKPNIFLDIDQTLIDAVPL